MEKIRELEIHENIESLNPIKDFLGKVTINLASDVIKTAAVGAFSNLVGVPPGLEGVVGSVLGAVVGEADSIGDSKSSIEDKSESGSPTKNSMINAINSNIPMEKGDALRFIAEYDDSQALVA